MDAQVGFEAKPAQLAESQLQYKEVVSFLAQPVMKFGENFGLIVRPEDIMDSQYLH
ncbi:hypothetical protein D3C86_1727050 [compost metagenome]